MGADIVGAGTSELIINGVSKGSMHGVEYSTIPDRIEAGSYMCMVAACGGEVIIQNMLPSHLTFVTNKLLEIGVNIRVINPYALKISKKNKLVATDIITQPFPGFPTDMQAPIMAVLTLADGVSIITESLYENRFMQIPELRRMGANIQQEGLHALVKGVDYLTGTDVKASDLRAGAAMIIAALAAKGRTIIGNIHHIDRGYEKLEEKLTALGANIKRVATETILSDNQKVNL
jgi:UDP-N-acetylglucosamine 1-carboxyvinyltransferase